MARAARITTQETVTLCGCVHDLRVSINRDGRRRPKLEDWAREIEPMIERLLTACQIERVVVDCGYSRSDLFLPEAGGKTWGELALEIQVLQRHRAELRPRLAAIEAYCIELEKEIKSLKMAVLVSECTQGTEAGGLQ